MTRIVLFVCPHGAAKSRMAAAFFNAAAPDDWRATDAGQEPASAVSPHAVRLLAGDHANTILDRAPPRPIGAVTAPARVVAIDCEVPGALRWDLRHQNFDEAMRDELRSRAEGLARQVADGEHRRR